MLDILAIQAETPSIMKITLALLLATTVTANAEGWSVGTTVYNDVKIMNNEAVYVTILGSDGSATIELSNLPPALKSGRLSLFA